MNLKYTYQYNQIKNDITVVYPCFFLVMIFLHFIVFLQFRKIKLEKKEWNFRESFLTKEFMKYDCCHISGTFLLLRLLHYVCECLVGFALILIVWNFPSYFVSSNNNMKIHELHSCNFIRIKHFLVHIKPIDIYCTMCIQLMMQWIAILICSSSWPS